MSVENARLGSLGVRFVVVPRTKVMAIVASVGAALASGFWWYYFRRKKRKAAQDKDSKGNTMAAVASRPSQSAMPISKPSSSSLSAHQRRRGSASRSTSGSAVGPLMGAHGGAFASAASRHFAFVHAGLENLTESTVNFERSVRLLKDLKTAGRQERELLEHLEHSLESTRRLHSDLNKLIERLCPEALDEMSVASTLTPMGSQYALYESSRFRRTLSVLSDDSFVSALDELSFPDVEAPVREMQVLPFEDLEFYKVGWTKANDGDIQHRRLRTEFLHCVSDEDFLAKLHCVREAFALIMADCSKRCWIAGTGRELLSGLLQRAGKDSSNFCKAYDAMLEFVHAAKDWKQIEEELSYRQVKEITFYDVVLDFILMDAFEDLAHPPASILAVAQNRFFGASFKETTLSGIVWSVIKTKRARLQYGQGFISHFYDISEQVSPTMAWGFLGTDEALREVCYYFKDQVCNFLIDIFSLDRVRYTKPEELAEDIYQVCQHRMTATQQRLAPARDDSTPSLNYVDTNGVDDHGDKELDFPDRAILE